MGGNLPHNLRGKAAKLWIPLRKAKQNLISLSQFYFEGLATLGTIPRWRGKGVEMKAGKTNFYGYNKRLQPNAHELRKTMTKAEACLWKYALRAGIHSGYGFRRQRPVLNFIADFMCKELKLIIEVDGITHSWAETVEKDRIRDEALTKVGFHILRFEDDMFSIRSIVSQKSLMKKFLK